jgi:hypothetical protein
MAGLFMNQKPGAALFGDVTGDLCPEPSRRHGIFAGPRTGVSTLRRCCGCDERGVYRSIRARRLWPEVNPQQGLTLLACEDSHPWLNQTAANAQQGQGERAVVMISPDAVTLNPSGRPGKSDRQV